MIFLVENDFFWRGAHVLGPLPFYVQEKTISHASKS